MEAIISFLGGVIFLVFLIQIRNSGESRWAAYYWVVLGIGILICMHFPYYSFLTVAFIPTSIKIISRFWFLQKQHWDALLFPIGYSILFLIIYSFTAWLPYAMAVYIIIEIVSTYRYLSKLFRGRGIGWFIGSGKRLEWYRFFPSWLKFIT